MIITNYPLIGSDEFLTVKLFDPEPEQCDSKCKWEISGPNFSKSAYSYGIDDLQALYLAMKIIKVTINQFEKNSGLKCDYTFYMGENE